MRGLLAVVVMIGCGRFGFEPVPGAGTPDGGDGGDSGTCPARHTLYLARTLYEIARLDCRSRGQWLVTIDDAGENEAVRVLAFAAAGTEKVWIGINDVQTEGTYVWDGPPSGFTAWVAGQPNDGAGGSTEDCGAMDPDGLWRDEDCVTEVFAYVCECE